MNPESILISIIIPTHNRVDKLMRLLLDLEQQSVPLSSFEVIVVDDGSTDNTAVRVKDWENSHDNIIYLNQENQGQSVARNTGIAQARGQIIGFVDDDCRTDKDWLKNALELFKDPEVGGVQGLTYCDPKDISALSMQIRNLADGNYETCNIFYRREVLALVGGLDPELRFYREDTDLAWRVLDQGFEIPFSSLVKVEHPPHQYTLRQLLRKRLKFRWAYYDRYFEKKHPQRFKQLKMLGIFSPALVAFYPVYFAFLLFLVSLFLPGSCFLAVVNTLILLILVYLLVCLIYINEMARGIRLERIARRPKALLKFCLGWWIIMGSELFFHVAGSIKYRKFSC